MVNFTPTTEGPRKLEVIMQLKLYVEHDPAALEALG